MKIYNKKGFIFGILWTALGVSSLIISILSPDDFLPKEIKNLVIAIVVILIGISGFYRAFSKKATREDKIQEQDERNRLLTLKTKSLTLKILYGCLALVAIGGLIAYELTNRTAWIDTIAVAGVLLGFMLLVEIVVSIYYEKHM